MKNKKTAQKSNQYGFIQQLKLLLLFVGVIFIVIGIHKFITNHQGKSIPEIRSAIVGYCLDDHHDRNSKNAEIDMSICNGRQSQLFTVNSSTIKHGSNQCLDVLDSGKQLGDDIVLNNCDRSSSQKWLVDEGGFLNTSSGLCLTDPDSDPSKQPTLGNCGSLSGLNLNWAADVWSNPVTDKLDCSKGSEGVKVACYAKQQWQTWNSGKLSHKALLAKYSDGNGYEEWCADFVSYVYKEAGYSFKNGERGNGSWDEYNAKYVQYMEFTKHAAAGYHPTSGDIAYFDYPGGHVEIVISGGSHPTFIYGDSGASDPATKNGEMNEDTLTNDGSAGQVTYYLSPN